MEEIVARQCCIVLFCFLCMGWLQWKWKSDKCMDVTAYSWIVTLIVTLQVTSTFSSWPHIQLTLIFGYLPSQL